MSRIHDLGSLEGFIPPAGLTEDDPPFAFDWQAHLYAIHRLLAKKGVYTLDEFRDALERLPPADYLRLGYYERWLAAVPPLVIQKCGLDVEIPARFDEYDHHHE